MGHAYLTEYIPAFPKPAQIKRQIPHVKIMPDGREILQTRMTHSSGAEGRAEYKRRVRLMWERQDKMCCLFGFIPECPGRLDLRVATFEHENCRGGGKRDDRISLPNGDWINGAAHAACNGLKGSRRIAYNRARNQGRTGSVDEAF